jgi:demethylmenaquinone methyltransferase/2-methoxy-6-polyprenyl-1,4-benzoquinol methylase
VDACFVGFFWSGILRRDIPRFLSGLAISAAGARLVIVDNRYVAGSHRAISRTDEDGNAYQQRQHRDSPTWEALANYPTAAQVRADLHGIADDVEVEELTYYWIATATLRGG